MKNVIYLVIDSFSYREFEKDKGCFMPFVYSLLDCSLWTDKSYSMGPHTELGLRGLMGSCHTLDYGGNLLRFDNCPKLLFDYFLENGYEVHNITYFGNKWPLRLFDNNMYYEHYSQINPGFEGNWPHRFEHFATLLQNEDLTALDRIDAEKYFEQSINDAIHFYDNDNRNQREWSMLEREMETINCKYVVQILKEEKKKYELDKVSYINELLLHHEENPLFNLLQLKNQTKEYDADFIEYFFQTYKNFLRRLRGKMISANLFNKVDWIEFLKAFCNTVVSKFGKERNNYYIQNYKVRIENYKPYNQDDDPNMKKTIYKASFRKQLRKVYEILDSISERNVTPFFICIHAEEMHNITNWCSLDIAEKQNLANEMKMAEEVLDHLGADMCGDLTYQLSMRYVDDCIRELFEELEKRELLENTNIVITADHGSSYGSYPLRCGRMVNNWHSENYNIPFIYYNKIKAGKVSGVHENIDFTPTILDSLGIHYGDDMKGESFWNRGGKEVAISEYTGPGCPDIYRNEIWFVARNIRYSVYYTVRINQSFEDGRLCAVYDMEKDYLEKKNIARLISVTQISDILESLRKRFEKIKKEYI